MKKIGAEAGLVFLGAAVLIAFMVWFYPMVIMLLWNYVVADYFGWKRIDFWHAFALWILCQALFTKTQSLVTQK